MTLLDWLAVGFGVFATGALIGCAWIMVRVHVRPRDLTDEEIWSPEDWP